jgi:hypothetical protein
MEFAQLELAAVEKAADATRAEVEELNELQLAMVGGGCGEVVFG